MVPKRSPRYPRHGLAKAIEMTRKLFDGAHQAKVDVDAAARVIGYAGSSGGAAQGALGALRQYGLVDGLRGDIAVSELAMRILQPMDESERRAAMKEAASKPEVFERVLAQFGGKLPGSDEPVRAFLIRQEGFSANGANDVVEALRNTMSTVIMDDAPETQNSPSEAPVAVAAKLEPAASDVFPPLSSHDGNGGELITLPLGQDCRVQLRFVGEVTSVSYARLIRHLELMKEVLSE